MSNETLDNLVRIGKLATEAPSRSEFDGLLSSARKRLHDAEGHVDVSTSLSHLAVNTWPELGDFVANVTLLVAASRREGPACWCRPIPPGLPAPGPGDGGARRAVSGP